MWQEHDETLTIGSIGTKQTLTIVNECRLKYINVDKYWDRYPSMKQIQNTKQILLELEYYY